MLLDTMSRAATQCYLNSRELKANCCFVLATAATTTPPPPIILFPEAVTNKEEVPAPLSIHVPHIGLLACILCIRFVDEMHKKNLLPKDNSFQVLGYHLL
jgi:hypothetical protein